MFAKQSTTTAEGIVIPFTNSYDENTSASLTFENIKCLSAIHPICTALHNALGDRLSINGIADMELLLGLTPEAGNSVPYGIVDFIADLRSAQIALEKNSCRERPLPLASAVKRQELIDVLKTTSTASRNCGVTAYAVVGNQRTAFPIATATDFVGPVGDDVLRRTGAFTIVGLIRDDERGHQLLLTRSKLVVSLPLDDQRWSWLNIRHILDEDATLDGTIIRESKSSMWTPDPGAKLVTQMDLLKRR